MTWEYIAGFFDGEGCVRLYQGKQGQARPYVQMSQAVPREGVLLEIQKFLKSHGIETYFRRDKSTNPGWNDCCSLKISTREGCAEFLRNVLPHMHAKKDEAEEVLSNLDKNPSRRGGLNRLLVKKRDVKEMIRLWTEEGMTQTEIAERFGLHQVAVSRLIRRNLSIAV